MAAAPSRCFEAWLFQQVSVKGGYGLTSMGSRVLPDQVIGEPSTTRAVSVQRMGKLLDGREHKVRGS